MRSTSSGPDFPASGLASSELARTTAERSLARVVREHRPLIQLVVLDCQRFWMIAWV
jgi:hypothetical protein